jgi:hypothetical protein
MYRTRLTPIAAALSLMAAPTAAFAAPGHATTSQPAAAIVCNQAQSSWRGTMDATASTDPLPPARHKSTAMPVGRGKGLTNAATNSPALAVCVPQTPPDDGGDGTGTGTS